MKPTQQEIIDVARAVDIVPGIGDVVNGKYRPHKNALGKSVPVEWLQEFAKLLLERFGACGGEPVARLMKYVGKGTYPKKGYTVARTYEECPKDAYPNDWEEGPELHTHPSPTDLRAEYLRGLEDAKRVALYADHMGSVNLKLMKIRIGNAIEALKGKQ